MTSTAKISSPSTSVGCTRPGPSLNKPPRRRNNNLMRRWRRCALGAGMNNADRPHAAHVASVERSSLAFKVGTNGWSTLVAITRRVMSLWTQRKRTLLYVTGLSRKESCPGGAAGGNSLLTVRDSGPFFRLSLHFLHSWLNHFLASFSYFNSIITHGGALA